MWFNFILSSMFLMLNHPLSLGLILLLQTISVSLITGNFCYNMWFSYILFLIMIGGMLILFIYMTSIASNMKFNSNYKMLLIFPIYLIIFFYLNKYDNLINMNNNEINQFNNNLNINMSMMKFFNTPYIMLMMFLISYLFITLIATVKITELKNGPLRKFN